MTALERFALVVLRKARDRLGCDIDIDWLLNQAERAGLLVSVPVTEPCGELCRCAEEDEFPTTCLRYSADVWEALAAMEKENERPASR